LACEDDSTVHLCSFFGGPEDWNGDAQFDWIWLLDRFYYGRNGLLNIHYIAKLSEEGKKSLPMTRIIIVVSEIKLESSKLVL
jgi:hypothetical protein